MITSDSDSQKIRKPRSSARAVVADPSAAFKPTKIRTELNIEKWPAIWNPTHSNTHTKLNGKPRTLEREMTASDGTKTASKVTINPIAHLGDLTTEDQRTLYALIKHWEDKGKPPHETAFSIRQVAKLLNKSWGTNVIDSVTGSLERLRGTMLVWTRSYRSKDQRVEDLETIYVNILSKLKIVRRKIDGHITTEAGYFQFDDHILKNLLANYTKPFLFDVFMDIKGEIALKLYSYIDLIMADKNHFERCTLELFADLGLTGASYRHPSKRKQNLERALRELQGILLTTGVLKSAVIERTKDGKDYKVVFHKVARRDFELGDPSISFSTPEPVVINDYNKIKDPIVEQAEALVGNFYKVFHGVEKHYVQSKETDQALSLITQHGLDRAKHIVSFSKDVAGDTNYLPQTFGGIMHYASRALADFDQKTKVVPARPAVSVTEEAVAPKFERGERRLLILTPEQSAVRFEQAKVVVLGRHPNMARLAAGPGSLVLEKMVRAQVVRQLEDEPMNLMLLSTMPVWSTP